MIGFLAFDLRSAHLSRHEIAIGLRKRPSKSLTIDTGAALQWRFMPRKLRIQYPGAIYPIKLAASGSAAGGEGYRAGRRGGTSTVVRVDGEPSRAGGCDALRRDWLTGSEEFRQELLVGDTCPGTRRDPSLSRFPGAGRISFSRPRYESTARASTKRLPAGCENRLVSGSPAKARAVRPHSPALADGPSPG